jgi:hypothetical protein
MPWRIHAAVFAIGLCVCFGFVQLSPGFVSDFRVNVLRSVTPQSQVVPGSGSLADAQAVFADPKASWAELERAVGGLADAEVTALLSDSNAQIILADSNREALNYLFFNKIGKAESTATLLQQLAGEAVPASLTIPQYSMIQRAGHLGWLLAHGPSQAKSSLPEAAVQYDFKNYLNFIRAYCTCGFGRGPDTDYSDATVAGQSKFGSEKDYAVKMMQSTALGWVEVRPRAAIDFILAQSWPTTYDRGETLKACISLVFTFDPDLAQELLAKSVPALGGNRVAAFCMDLLPKNIGEIFESLDAPGRAAFLKGLRGVSTANRYALSQVCIALDPAKLNGTERDTVAVALVGSVPEVAEQWFLRIPEGDRAKVLSKAYKDTDAPTPLGAIELCLNLYPTLGKGSVSDDLVVSALGDAAYANPDAAFRDLAKLPQDIQEKALGDFYSGIAEREIQTKPGEISAFMLKVPEKLRDQVVQSIVYDCERDDPERVLQFVRTISDPKLSAKLTNEILVDGPLPAPELEKETLEGIQRTGQPAAFHDALKRVLGEYCKYDPAKAVSCLGQVADPALQQKLTDDMAKTWCSTDVAAASKWINDLPNGAGRDSAIADLVKAAKDQPEAALSSAPAIDDDDLRIKVAASVISAWNKIDKSYAVGLLEKTDLSDEDKAAVGQLVTTGSYQPNNQLAMIPLRSLRFVPALIAGSLVAFAIPAARMHYASRPARTLGFDTDSTQAGLKDWVKRVSELHGGSITALDLIRLRQSTQKWLGTDIDSLVGAINSDGLAGVLQGSNIWSAVKDAALADPARAMETIFKLSPEQGRDAALLDVMKGVSHSKPEEVVAFLPVLPDYLRRRAEQELRDNFGNKRGVEAIVNSLSRLPLAEWQWLVGYSVQSWAQDDPLAATQDVIKLVNSGVPMKGIILSDYQNALMALNPRALERVSETLPKVAGVDYLDTAVYYIATSGENKAEKSSNLNAQLQWVELRQDPQEKARALAAMAKAAASFDPQQAVAIAQNLPSMAARNDVYKQATDTALQSGTSSAATWAETIPEPLSRYSSESQIATKWLKSDPEGYVNFALSGNRDPGWISILKDKYPALSGTNPGSELPDWAKQLAAGTLQQLQAPNP